MKSEARVFISYAKEDYKIAKRLYDDLKQAGVKPWLDDEDLLPGQNWKLAIKKALKRSSYCLALLSSSSVSKRGYVQKELKLALEALDEFPEDEIFIIPVRVDDCKPNHEGLRELHRVDLFRSYENCLNKIRRVVDADKGFKKETHGAVEESIRPTSDAIISEKNLPDLLLPNAMVNTGETDFEKRFGLKYKEPLVRVRILDPKVAAGIIREISDLSLPISEFSRLDLECTNVFIVENLRIFLSFPERPESIVIFGMGIAVENLGAAKWLADKNLIYWGDLDVYGFQILSALRSHFPRTVSMMMDMETFTAFEEFTVKGPEGKTDHLSRLTAEENRVFQTLRNRTDRNRLEQERISHRYAVEKIQENF